MVIFNIILKFFRKHDKYIAQTDQRLCSGYEASEIGQCFYADRKLEEALRYFDTAISLGFQDENVYASRGSCLQSLGFDLDAIDDFCKAIEFDPFDSNFYFMRALSKGAIGDLDGQVDGLLEAIAVVGADSSANRSHDEWAREKRYEDVADMYRMRLRMANLDLDRQKSDERRLRGSTASLGADLISRRRAKAKRRGEQVASSNL